MTKGLWVHCPSPMLSKKLVLFYTFTFFLTSSVFGTISLPLPICPFATSFFFIKSPQPRFHKSYPQSKTFLNIQAVPSSAVFCSNAVLITTPSSSMHFFEFLGCATKCPYYHWNDLNTSNVPHYFDFFL